MEKLNVNVEDAVKELQVLTGEAPKQRPVLPKEIELYGEIDAPMNYAGMRLTEEDFEKAVLLINRKNLFAELKWNIGTDLQHCVAGGLKINPDLQEFDINGTMQSSLKEMAELLKRRKYFFTDKTECAKAVSELRSFKGKLEKELEHASDNKGNSKDLVERKLVTNIDIRFGLSMPVFVGGESKSFEVEVCFDVRDAGVSCWLESEELHTIIVQERDSRINALKEYFEHKCPVIEQ